MRLRVYGNTFDKHFCVIEKFFRGVDSLHDGSRFLLFLVSFSNFTKIIFSELFVTANVLIQFVKPT